jgi:hypothetical protein
MRAPWGNERLFHTRQEKSYVSRTPQDIRNSMIEAGTGKANADLLAWRADVLFMPCG